jgi:lysozyme
MPNSADQVVVDAARCCQLSNNPHGKPTDPQSEIKGYGSGGCRCTEACAAMVDFSYKIGPKAQDGKHKPEDAMFEFTEMLNNGADVSHMEPNQWVVDWVNKHGVPLGVSMKQVQSTFEDIVRLVDAGHIAMAAFSDYNKLQLSRKRGSPYSWHDADNEGHVLMVVGYRKSDQVVFVHDPLLGEIHQPEEYTFASFKAARFYALYEVIGNPLQFMGDASPAPQAAPRNVPVLKDALAVDVSKWQGSNIDWNQYAAWSRKNAGDNRARVIMRASQGSTDRDTAFEINWRGAIAAGIEHIGVYHYCLPGKNTPQQEAAFFKQVVGERLRQGDFVMVDFEENVPQATDSWLLQFAQEVQRLFGRVPVIYASLNYIKVRLHDSSLGRYPLVLADWTYDRNARPTCPAPFKNLLFIQYSNKGTVPGIPGQVDMDVFVGALDLTPPPAPATTPPAPQVVTDPALVEQHMLDQATIAGRDRQIADLKVEAGGLRSTISSLESQLQGVQAQLAAEIENNKLLHADLEAARKAAAAPCNHEEVKQQLQEAHSGLNFFPDLQRFIGGILSKL